MTTSEQIIQVINALCEKLGIAIDWTAENIMPQIEMLCTKFIHFEICISIYWVCFMFALCLICWIPTIVLCHKAQNLDSPWDEYDGVTFGAIACLIVSIIVSITAICVIGIQIYDIVEATTFPEKVIYEYISGHLSK